MTAPKVTIGLPVYNGEKYLAAAIESHLAQSFGDFVLIISDNGSTDSTGTICTGFANRDRRVRYFRSPENRGILWNHRRVMSAAGTPGPYFRWAGADDILEPGLLQAMVAVLDSRPEVAAVLPETRNIDAAGDIIRHADRTLDLQSPHPFERAHRVLTADFQHVIAYGLLRTEILAKMRTGPAYPGWDAVFTWELALRGQLVQAAGPGLLRRYHAGSISRVKTAKELRKWVEPTAKAGLSFPHWKWAYERWRSSLACPLSLRDRLRIAALLARSMLWNRAELTRDVTQATRRALRLSDEYTF